MRVGVIGLQHFHAHEMIAGLRGVPDVELVAIAEADDKTWQEQGARYGLPRYADYLEMLESEKIEAVALVNARAERARVARECLDLGVSVLSDKPVCMDLEELAALRQAAAHSGAAIFLYLAERYNPPVITLLDLVRQGTLGRVVSFAALRPHKLNRDSRPAWFWKRETYGGILVDLTIHDVDIFRQATGVEVEEVYAIHANVSTGAHPGFEDIGHMILRGSDGVVGVFRADWLTPAGEPCHGDCRYFVVGDRGWAEVRTMGGLAEVTGGSVRVTTSTSGPVYAPLMAPKTTIFEDFALAARGHEPAISAKDIFRASELVLLGRESADRGVPVQGGRDDDRLRRA